MKKSILIIATVVLGLLNANATSLHSNLNTTIVSVDITKENLVEVYDWTVKTTAGEFSGTTTTLFDAKRLSNLAGQGEVVLERKITNYFVLKSEMYFKKSRVYFWEVQSKKGYAKGFSSTEFSAKKMIDLVAKGDIITFRIIESKNK